MVTLHRAGIRTKKCKGEPNVFASRGKKQWRNNTEQGETKIVMHASGVGRKESGKSTEYRIRKKAKTSKKAKLYMYFVQ